MRVAVAGGGGVALGLAAPFVEQAIAELESTAGVTVERARLHVARLPRTTREVTAIHGVGGPRVGGVVMYGMSGATALAIAARAAGERTVGPEEAVAALADRITGRAAARLADAGCPCEVTPPAVVLGEGCALATLDALGLVVALESTLGTFEVRVGLSAREQRSGLP